MWDERRQTPVSFLGAGKAAQPLRVSLFTEPAAAIREVINAKKVKRFRQEIFGGHRVQFEPGKAE
jgi:hypothetical protein